MIASLTGTVEEYTETGVVLNVNGVGFSVQTSSDAIQILSSKGPEEIVHLYTYLYIGREGDMNLFGFLSKEELGLFRKLITVSGIGPKGALSLLSVMSADDLIFAILSGDAKTISRAPGIGKKTAERLVIDLRDKLELRTAEDLVNNPYAAAGALGGAGITGTGIGAPGVPGSGAAGDAGSSAAADAAEALTALGYARIEAVKAVKSAAAAMKEEDWAGNDETEQLLKRALQYLS